MLMIYGTVNCSCHLASLQVCSYGEGVKDLSPWAAQAKACQQKKKSPCLGGMHGLLLGSAPQGTTKLKAGKKPQAGQGREGTMALPPSRSILHPLAWVTIRLGPGTRAQKGWCCWSKCILFSVNIAREVELQPPCSCQKCHLVLESYYLEFHPFHFSLGVYLKNALPSAGNVIKERCSHFSR